MISYLSLHELNAQLSFYDHFLSGVCLSIRPSVFEFFAAITWEASTRFSTLHHYKIVCMILQKIFRESEDLHVNLRIFSSSKFTLVC